MKANQLGSPASITTAEAAAPARAPRSSEPLSAVQLLRRSLDTFLKKDIKGWAEFCDENVVVEFPFAPDEASRRMVGRSAFYEYLKDYPDVIDLRGATTMTIHATDDPNLAIAEWSVSGHVIPNGNPYEMSYATFATFKNGLLVHYREYWNPQVFLAAMDGEMF